MDVTSRHFYGLSGPQSLSSKFYRAEAAAKKGQDPNLVMFNRVLCRYSDNVCQDEKVQGGLSSWHSWLAKWWKTTFCHRYPQIKPYVPNWDKMISSVIAMADKTSKKNRALRHWGHLIIDEGQDFAKDFYRMARIVLKYAKETNVKNVALTVLADDNQRLNADTNSTLAEIETSLALSSDRHYRLTRNYRNTYEIAQMAAYFYCGLSSGIPDLPDGRHGRIPCIVRQDSLDTSVDHIKRFVMNQSDLEIGVFLPNRNLQVKYYNKLEYRLRGVPDVKVQRYTSNDQNHGDPKSLEFDCPGTVTVLCDSSCKGLEFDAVFIPELQARPWDPASIEHFRMQMYVLSSRARQHLTFMYSATANEQIPIPIKFPTRKSGILEWIDG